MEWYYAEGKERRGPVPDAELRALLDSGRITRETLVWRQGMANWAALQTVVDAGPPLLPGHERCIITGKTFPTSQMIQTEHGWVSAEGRDQYYQRLREGVPLPSVTGVPTARVDGKLVVVSAFNAQLPLRCFKTGEPVSAGEAKHKDLYWCNPWYALTILLSILIYIIIYFVTRKKVTVDIPLSAAGRSVHLKRVLIAWGMFIGGVACFPLAAALANPGTFFFVLLGIVLVLTSVFYGNRRATLARVTKYENGEAWLAGAGPEFLTALPPYR
jgi:hypothetical protein